MQTMRPSFVQEQRLKMNPMLIQSIKLMELPVTELRERIEQELERNPALEILEDKSTVSLNETELQKKDEYENMETTSASDIGRRGSERASEEHRRFMEGVLTRSETLQEHLLRQLQLEPIDSGLRAIAETLIQNLDDNGFHKERPETLFAAIQPRLNEAMKLVQELEPAGTCTNDYHESLTVQLRLSKDAPAETQKIEKALNELKLLERGKYSELAKKIGLTEEDTRLICEYIKKLCPFPGRAFASADVRYVIPDIKVIRENDEFSIKLNDEIFPVLGINPYFDKISGSEDQAARDFARENIKEARLFINHLSQRNQTLIRVANAILQFQRSFFLNGPKYLNPLTLSDIAKELEIHEATVSRTSNGKYMQTEWGIFEIRYFFTNSVSGTGISGSAYSKEGVKEVIKEILAAENRLLSDQEISALLSQKGIALARRTVAKYRKELDMGSSYTRKIRE